LNDLIELAVAWNGWRLASNAAHPGYARTELIKNGQGGKNLLSRLLEPFFSHSAADGALPTLFAATSPKAREAGKLWSQWIL
jgi:hypothetical protein